MDILAVLLAPVVALVGVWLGGRITSRDQERLQEREVRQRSREALRSACRRYLAAARQFDQYLMDSRTTIDAVPRAIGTGAIPLFDASAEPHLQALESASAGMLFVAVSVDTVERATRLRSALMRLAAARAEYRAAGTVPDGLVIEVRAAERHFIDAARHDLDLDPIPGTLRTTPLP